MSRKQPPRKEKSAANMQNKNEADLGQKEARIQKEKTSELASMGEKSVQSEKTIRDREPITFVLCGWAAAPRSKEVWNANHHCSRPSGNDLCWARPRAKYRQSCK